MSLIYENKGIRLEHLDNYIYHKYTGLVDKAEWREGFQAGIKYCFQNPKLQWLNDLSGFWGTDCNNVIWLHDNVNGRINELEGLKKLAFVLPDKKFKTAHCNMNFYIEFSRVQIPTVCIVPFKQLDTAIEWVKLG